MIDALGTILGITLVLALCFIVAIAPIAFAVFILYIIWSAGEDTQTRSEHHTENIHSNKGSNETPSMTSKAAEHKVHYHTTKAKTRDTRSESNTFKKAREKRKPPKIVY